MKQETERQKKMRLHTEEMLDASPEEREEWVEEMFNACKYDYEKYVLAMLYVYGMRPAELFLVTPKSFTISEDSVLVRLPTLKGGIRRNLLLNRAKTPFLDFIVSYVNSNAILLPPSWRAVSNINTMFGKIAKKIKAERVPPYLFRHFRLSYIAEKGADDSTLKAWKGSLDPRSIAPYTALRPVTKLRNSIGW
jgi:integrase